MSGESLVRRAGSKALACIVAVALAAGLCPAPAMASIAAAPIAPQSTSDKVNIVEDGKHAQHRNMSVGGRSYELKAQAKAGAGALESCSWSADDGRVVTLSGAEGASVAVSPAAEGCTYVRLSARLRVEKGGKPSTVEGADECMFTVWTPVAEVGATVAEDAAASWGARDDATSGRGELAEGTRVAVVGVCGDRYRVRADASAYGDGDASQYSFVDMGAVELDEPEDPEVSIIEGGEPAAHREAAVGGAPLALSARVDSPAGAPEPEWSWESDDEDAVPLSRAAGGSTEAEPAAEGFAWVSLSAEFPAEVGEPPVAGDECLVTVWTPLGERAPGSMARDAEASFDGDGAFPRGTLAAGTPVDVVGTCGGLYRVSAASHPDGDPSPYSFVAAEDVSVPVAEVRLPEGPLRLACGGVSLVRADTYPAVATETGLAWSSSDPGVVYVGELGDVVGLQAGAATVTATAPSGASASVRVEVSEDASPPPARPPGSLTIQSIGFASVVSPVEPFKGAGGSGVEYKNTVGMCVNAKRGLVFVMRLSKTGRDACIASAPLARVMSGAPPGVGADPWNWTVVAEWHGGAFKKGVDIRHPNDITCVDAEYTYKDASGAKKVKNKGKTYVYISQINGGAEGKYGVVRVLVNNGKAGKASVKPIGRFHGKGCNSIAFTGLKGKGKSAKHNLVVRTSGLKKHTAFEAVKKKVAKMGKKERAKAEKRRYVSVSSLSVTQAGKASSPSEPAYLVVAAKKGGKPTGSFVGQGICLAFGKLFLMLYDHGNAEGLLEKDGKTKRDHGVLSCAVAYACKAKPKARKLKSADDYMFDAASVEDGEWVENEGVAAFEGPGPAGASGKWLLVATNEGTDKVRAYKVSIGKKGAIAYERLS